MNTETQAEALRLADALENGTYLLSVERDATHAELRRLHAENLQLRADLEAVGAGGIGPLIAAPKPKPQGEQQPAAVASMPFCHLEWLIGETVTAEQVFEMSRQGVKLYTRPQPRKPLTVEQIDGIIRDLDPSWLDTPTGFEEEFCRAIERAHGIGGDA